MLVLLLGIKIGRIGANYQFGRGIRHLGYHIVTLAFLNFVKNDVIKFQVSTVYAGLIFKSVRRGENEKNDMRIIFPYRKDCE